MDHPEVGRLLLNETVKNPCPGSVSFAPFCSHVETMETPTNPFEAKRITQTPSDEPTLSIALWAIGGVIIFVVVIFALVIYGPL